MQPLNHFCVICFTDFSKRRFHPYNPRWDLDLQIVPPPLAASELMDKLKILEDQAISSVPVPVPVPAQIKKEEVRLTPVGQPQIVPIDSKTYDETTDVPTSVTRSKVINSNGTVIVLSEDDDPSAILKTVEASSNNHDGVPGNNAIVTNALIKKEVNHDSAGANGKKAYHQDQIVLDSSLTSSLMARYEKVMSERNQDFSKFSADTIVTRAHGKGNTVH